MNYNNKATAKTPAYVVFVIDASGSMSERQGADGPTRIELVQAALREVIFQMVDMSTKVVNGQPVLRPRFRIAIIGYNDRVYTYLKEGFAPLDEFVKYGIPNIIPSGETNTAQAFLAVEQLLDQVLPTLENDWPAPLICHLTDGVYNIGDSPLPVASRIKARQTPDGPVLIENIFFADNTLRSPISSVREWKGVKSESDLVDRYAIELLKMSSEIPSAYLETIRYWGFSTIQPGAKLMFPGTNPELIKKALVATGSSGGMPANRRSMRE